MEKVSNKQKVLCIIQARMGSTRLPGKVLMKVRGIPLLAHEISRVKRSGLIHTIVVATTLNPEDQKIARLCENLHIPCFRGSVQDVLSRYAACAKEYPGYETIVRITGDCPLIDPEVVDRIIACFQEGNYDYASNTIHPSYPDGMDAEVFSRNALKEADRKATLPSDREHVTPYIRKKRSFRKGSVEAPADFSSVRLTVDNPEDLKVVRFVMERSSPAAGYLHYISLCTRHPRVFMQNMHLERNEGYRKSLREDQRALRKERTR